MDSFTPDEVTNMQQMIMAIGVYPARILLRLACVKHPECYDQVAALSNISEQSCKEFTFPHINTGELITATVYLDECPINHDLGAQLNIIQSIAKPSEWPAILQHISTYMSAARHIYSTLVQNSDDLLTTLYGSAKKTLSVEPSNLTMYIDPDEPIRVGLCARLGSFHHIEGATTE